MSFWSAALAAFMGSLVAAIGAYLVALLNRKATRETAESTIQASIDNVKTTVNASREAILTTIKSNEKVAKGERVSADRDRWWERFVWANKQVRSEDKEERANALSALSVLAQSQYAGPEERRLMNRMVYDTVKREQYKQAGERGA